MLYSCSVEHAVLLSCSSLHALMKIIFSLGFNKISGLHLVKYVEPLIIYWVLNV